MSGVPEGLPVSVTSIAMGLGQGMEGQGSRVRVQELTATSVAHNFA